MTILLGRVHATVTTVRKDKNNIFFLLAEQAHAHYSPSVNITMRAILLLSCEVALRRALKVCQALSQRARAWEWVVRSSEHVPASAIAMKSVGGFA